MQINSKRSVLLLFAFIASGLFSAALLRKNLWPFVPFKMYATAPDSQRYAKIHLVGELANGAQFPLSRNFYFLPYAQWEISNYLLRPLLDPNYQNAPKDLATLEALLNHYNRQVELGKHTGEKLRALLAYRIEWQLLPDPQNLLNPKSQTLLLRTANAQLDSEF